MNMARGVEGGVPRYSEYGARNRDLFLQYRNAILIYFEDEGYEEFYLRILRGVGVNFHFEDVFCLGGKEQLKKQMLEPCPEGKRRIFVFDKDFDDLLGRVVSGNEVVYLGKYSIENYIAMEDFFVDFVIDKKKKIRKLDVMRDTSFNDMLLAIKAWYDDVCRHFVVAQKYRLKIESTKLPAKEMVVDGSVEINQDWWSRYQEKFAERVRADQSWMEGEALANQLANAFNPDPRYVDIADEDEFSHFPGKHLIWIILGAYNSKYKIGKLDDLIYEFMMASAGRSSRGRFGVIKSRIEAAVQIKVDVK